MNQDRSPIGSGEFYVSRGVELLARGRNEADAKALAAKTPRADVRERRLGQCLHTWQPTERGDECAACRAVARRDASGRIVTYEVPPQTPIETPKPVVLSTVPTRPLNRQPRREQPRSSSFSFGTFAQKVK